MSKKKKNLAKPEGQARTAPNDLISKSTHQNRLAPPGTSTSDPTSPQDPRAVQPVQRIQRRDFLAHSAILLTGISALGICSIPVRLALADFDIGPPTQFPIGYPSDYRMGSLTWLREQDLFVLREELGLGVFSARCTHLGCTVQRTSDGFCCPCHGARFGPLGQLISGPARKGLPWYALYFEADGRLWVNTNRIVEPALQVPRSTTQLDPDQGDKF